jgi:hypothetical protein
VSAVTTRLPRDTTKPFRRVRRPAGAAGLASTARRNSRFTAVPMAQSSALANERASA